MVEIIDERRNTKEFIRNLKPGEYFCYKDHLYISIYSNSDYYEAVDLVDGELSEFDGDIYVDRVSAKIIIQN